MKVLLIEDDERFAELMKVRLADHEVEVAPTLTAAIHALNSQHFTLVLVDLGLPDSSGLDTLAALRPYPTPKMVVTANQRVSLNDVVSYGAVDYASKTSGFDDIIQRVRFNLEKRRPRARFAPSTFAQIRACIEAQKVAILS